MTLMPDDERKSDVGCPFEKPRGGSQATSTHAFHR